MMQSERKVGRALCHILSLLLFGGAVGASAVAGEMPKRKAGLWEMRTQMDGMPGGPPVQMCVDQASDNLMQQRAEEKPDCSTMDVKADAGGTKIHAVCRMAGSTVTMDAVYTGNFESSYKGDMKMRYNPPVHGMSEAHMVQEAKWLGSCKPGQKPSDVIMPNMGNFNMNEMMKDPRMQEMMKRQQMRGQ
ncbi:MAG TPA: DUF3617 family protein [Candidatus Binatia bacterium]|nr:DUF3617 family protein [Candidatus Binatia bacterium]